VIFKAYQSVGFSFLFPFSSRCLLRHVPESALAARALADIVGSGDPLMPAP